MQVKRLLAVTVSLFLLSCEPSPENDTQVVGPAKEACVLVMGWDPWKPYQYVNSDGAVAGLDVEIARAAAKAGGCTLEFVQGSWTELLGRLRTGEIDMLAGATRTPGREAYAEFTDAYRSESFVVYTRAESAALRDIASLDALLASPARLGSVTEYYYGDAISAALDRLHAQGRLREAGLAELNYERLRMGEIDAFIEDPFVASAILRDRSETDFVAPTGINIDAADVAFMLTRAGDSALQRERFRAGLARIRGDGKLAAIIDTWRTLP